MRILHVITGFYPAWAYGGQVRLVFEICKEMAKKHDVSVYTTDVLDMNSRVNISQNPQIVENIKIFRFKNLSNTLASKRIHTPLKMFFFARKDLKNYDIVHIHGTRSTLNIIIYHFLKKYNIPYVIQAHGSLPKNLGKENLKTLFDHICGTELLRNASKVIALTSTESKKYQSCGIDISKIDIIPNAIDSSNYTLLPEKGKFRKKFGIPNTCKMILSLGRLNWIKGLNLLIDAFAEVCRENPDIILVIAGPDDGEMSNLKKQVEILKLTDKIIFTGPLYDRDKLSAFQDADIFVLTSISDSFPTTILESWMCETPVIATKGCDLRDIISEGGILADSTIDSLKDSIIILLSDNEKSKILGKKGKLFAIKNFDTKIVNERLENCYHDAKRINLQKSTFQ